MGITYDYIKIKYIVMSESWYSQREWWTEMLVDLTAMWITLPPGGQMFPILLNTWERPPADLINRPQSVIYCCLFSDWCNYQDYNKCN